MHLAAWADASEGTDCRPFKASLCLHSGVTLLLLTFQGGLLHLRELPGHHLR